jgi:hypothetical protein
MLSQWVCLSVAVPPPYTANNLTNLVTITPTALDVITTLHIPGDQIMFPATLANVNDLNGVPEGIITSFTTVSDADHNGGWHGCSYTAPIAPPTTSAHTSVPPPHPRVWVQLNASSFPWLINGVFSTPTGGTVGYSYPLMHVPTGSSNSSRSNYPTNISHLQATSLTVTPDGVVQSNPTNLTITFPNTTYREPMTPPDTPSQFAFVTTGQAIALKSGGHLSLLYGTFQGHTAGFQSLVSVISTDPTGQVWYRAPFFV